MASKGQKFKKYDIISYEVNQYEPDLFRFL